MRKRDLTTPHAVWTSPLRGIDPQHRIHVRRFELNELVALPPVCQRIFFGKRNASAETIWVTCRAGECSPNRQFLAEPLQGVLRRGRCSEVVIRNAVDLSEPEKVMEIVRASLDERLAEKRRHNDGVQEAEKQQESGVIECDARHDSRRRHRRASFFPLRTIYVLRVSLLSRELEPGHAMLHKLVELLKHDECLVVSLVFLGCAFDNAGVSVLASYLETEPYFETLENLPPPVVEEEPQTTSGLKWQRYDCHLFVDGARPERRKELTNQALASALQRKWDRLMEEHEDDEVDASEMILEFKQPEWRRFGIPCVTTDQFVEVEMESGVAFFIPANESDDHGGEEDESHTIQFSKGIKTLVLRRAGLTSQNAYRLGQALEKNKNLRVLDLAQNPKIGDAGGEKLAIFLHSHPRIWHLSLQDCNIGDCGVEKLRILAYHRLVAQAQIQADCGNDDEEKGDGLSSQKDLTNVSQELTRTRLSSSMWKQSSTRSRLQDLTKAAMDEHGLVHEQPGDGCPEILPIESFRAVVGTLLMPMAIGALSGVKWQNIGGGRPTSGQELKNSQLGKALQTKTVFSTQEWSAFGITDLSKDHFIKSGVSFYKPVGLQTLTTETKPQSRRHTEESTVGFREGFASKIADDMMNLGAPGSNTEAKSPIRPAGHSNVLGSNDTKKRDENTVAVGVMMQERKISRPKNGNLAGPLMSWQQFSAAPPLMPWLRQTVGSSTSSDDDSCSERQSEESRDMTSDKLSLDWGGRGTQILKSRSQVLDAGMRALQAPRNSPLYQHEQVESVQRLTRSVQRVVPAQRQSLGERAVRHRGSRSPYGRPQRQLLTQGEKEMRYKFPLPGGEKEAMALAAAASAPRPPKMMKEERKAREREQRRADRAARARQKKIDLLEAAFEDGLV